MIDKNAALMHKLQYQFKDQSLLQLALTHRSKGTANYERLEFLGDSILGFVVTDWLLKHFPEEPEGRLSRMRSRLVRQDTLADIARTLELQEHLILGEGERKSGGFNRASILSDVVESLIGAMYIDSGFAQASQFIHRQFAELFDNMDETTNFKDPKSQLQEILQKHGYDLPDYHIVEVQGEPHKQQFTVQCVVKKLTIEVTATAQSRRKAEQICAADALRMVQDSLAKSSTN